MLCDKPDAVICAGIVSRVSMVRYSQSGRLLGIQIDAAINPGNSGGPAFADMLEGTVAGELTAMSRSAFLYMYFCPCVLDAMSSIPATAAAQLLQTR
jgi:hypothetical protein